jgi:hypothetical protein
MKCPTFCGFFYSSPKANEFLRCMLGNRCMSIEFTSFGQCKVPPHPSPPNLEEITGTWWLALIQGSDQIIDWGCQRMEFQQVSSQELRAVFSVPLTKGSETKICTSQGRFTRQPGGSVAVNYPNFVGYHESWYVVHKSANALLAHVCFNSNKESMEYGNQVFTRLPLDFLDPDEVEALNEAALRNFGLGLAAFERTDNTACPNQ